MRKKMLLLSLLLCLCSITLPAQSADCNQEVWINRFAKLLPKEVCIRPGFYHITSIYDRTDVNGDGLDDLILDWNKNPLWDGDSIFVAVYFQNQDSSFSLVRTFNHLYPIYFNRYDLDYIPRYTSLIPLLKKYQDFYPLINLKFNQGIIEITIRFDAEAELRVTYKYDKDINSWKYVKCEEVFLVGGGAMLRDMPWAFGPTIDNFTYFYWEKQEE